MILQAWDRFWFSPASLLPLAFFRISLGLLMCFMFLSAAPNWERFYALDGVTSLDVPKIQALMGPDESWSCFYWTEGLLPLRFWWVVGLLAAAGLTVGYQTRLCTIVLFILQSSMIHRARILTNGDDLVFRMVLFHGCFAPLGHRLSLDYNLGRHRDEKPPWAWAQRMLQINVALIYVISLPNKFAQDHAWFTGEAIYWTMASDMWYRGWFPELAYRGGLWFSKLATYGTVLIEGAFPILICFPKLRMLGVLPLTILHLSIAILIPHVLFFTLAMVASFWVYWPSAWLERLCARLDPSWGIKEMGEDRPPD